MLEKLHISPSCDGFLFLAESARNPPALRAHRHVELELNVVKSGTIQYVIDDRSYHFSRGTLLWLFPSQVHRLVDRSPDAAYYVAVFRPRMIRQCCRTRRYVGLRRSEPPRGVLQLPVPEKPLRDLLDLMEVLTQEGMDPDVLNREAGFGLTPGFEYQHGDPDGLNAGLRHLLLVSWRLQVAGGSASLSRSLHPAVVRALQIISDSESSMALPDLASKCGISSASLSRLFTRDMEMPISRYRNTVRLARFMQLWVQGNHSTVLECMHADGFGSYPQFYRVFREHYGQGPSAVLKQPLRSDG